MTRWRLRYIGKAALHHIVVWYILCWTFHPDLCTERKTFGLLSSSLIAVPLLLPWCSTDDAPTTELQRTLVLVRLQDHFILYTGLADSIVQEHERLDVSSNVRYVVIFTVTHIWQWSLLVRDSNWWIPHLCEIWSGLRPSINGGGTRFCEDPCITWLKGL